MFQMVNIHRSCIYWHPKWIESKTDSIKKVLFGGHGSNDGSYCGK